MATRLFEMTVGQNHDFLLALQNAGMSLEQADRLKQDTSLADDMVDWLRKQLAPSLVDLMASPQEQVNNLLNWMDHFGLNIAQTEIQRILENEPAVPEGCAIVLCWTLNTLQQTMDTKLAIARRVYGDNKVYVSSLLKTDKKHLKITDGAPVFQPNRLWWEVIDITSQRNVAPDKVEAATAAGTQVFDAAIQHPKLVRAQNGREFPYWDVPGLRVNVDGDPAWSNCPYVNGNADGGVDFYTSWAAYGSSSCVEPLVVSGE
jgi:hypothetical protein